jgi:hypothetical protein
MHRSDQDVSRRRVVVVFWRRGIGGVEFFLPILPGYLDTMGHVVSCESRTRPATHAQSWIETKFGFRPRANGRTYRTSIANAVAFTLNATEMGRLEGFGVWRSVRSVDLTLHMDGIVLLRHIESALSDS